MAKGFSHTALATKVRAMHDETAATHMLSKTDEQFLMAAEESFDEFSHIHVSQNRMTLAHSAIFIMLMWHFAG